MRRLLAYNLKGQRTDRVECRGGVRYQMSFQLEPTDPEVFWTFQQELALEGQRQGMLHRFNSSGRMALGALSYINLEARNRSLLDPGVPHLPRRLRRRQEPVALPVAVGCPRRLRHAPESWNHCLRRHVWDRLLLEIGCRHSGRIPSRFRPATTRIEFY